MFLTAATAFTAVRRTGEKPCPHRVDLVLGRELKKVVEGVSGAGESREWPSVWRIWGLGRPPLEVRGEGGFYGSVQWDD